MPFKSEKQRRFLWAEHPEIAKKWADKYPASNKGLPMYADDKKKEKAARLDVLGLISPYVNARIPLNNSIISGFEPENAKSANDKLVRVQIPHSDKPTYAGQEREEGEINTENDGEQKTEKRNPENAINSLLQKISVVLSQPMAQALENRKAIQEGRQPAHQPKNPGIRRYAAPTPVIPPPMGSQPQPAPAQPAQPAPAQPQAQGAGMNSPSANPINSFGALSTSGNINGNASFGIKNSPDSLKTGAAQSEFLAKVMSMDFPPHPDPEDLELDDEERAKTAYGVGDEYSELDRYLDGGFISGMKNDAAAAFTRRAGELAKKQNLNLRFSPQRYVIGTDDAEAAAKRLQAAKDLDSYDDQTLPYYYSLETKHPNFLRRMFGAQQPELDYDNHPLHMAWDEFNQPKKKEKKSAAVFDQSIKTAVIAGIKTWACRQYADEKMAFSLGLNSTPARKKKKKITEQPDTLPFPRRRSNNGLAGGIAAGAAAFPLYSMHQDAFGTYNTLRSRVQGVPAERLLFPQEMADSGLVQHGDVGTYFGEPQNIFAGGKPNTSKLTQGGEWTSGSGTYHGMLLRPALNNGKPDFQALEGGDAWFDAPNVNGKYDSPFHRFVDKQDAADAAAGRLPAKEVGLLSAAKGAPNYNSHLDDWDHTTSRNPFNRYYNAFTHAYDKNQPEEMKDTSLLQRMNYYLKHFKRQSNLLDKYKSEAATPEDMAAGYDFVSTRRHPMLITRQPQVTQLLESKKPGVPEQAKSVIDTAFDQQYPMRPYNLGGAITAGTRRVLFPHVPEFGPDTLAGSGGPDSIAPLPAPKCNEDYCVQPAGRVLQHLGAPVGVRPSMVLPADLAANSSAQPVGLMVPQPRESERAGLGLTGNQETDKPIMEKYKKDYQNKIINEWMPQSRNRRIMAGLAAAAAMGAAGYGTTKLVQNILKRRQKTLKKKQREEQIAKLLPAATAKAAADQQCALSIFLLECLDKVSR